MKSDKNQTLTMISVAMVLIGVVIIIVSLSMPRVYDDSVKVDGSETTYQNSTQSTTSSNSYIAQSGNSYTSNYSATGVATTTTPSKSANTAANVAYPLNLNTCTAEELSSINGVGDVRANSIIAYRAQLGKYTSVEQLKEIKGIGDGVYAKIAPYVTV